MPKISTHLHLALKLSKKINICNMDSFILGSAYPDCWNTSLEQSLVNHYKSDTSSLCNLELFEKDKQINDFNFGYYFHLWVDNRILEVNVEGISKDDCLICDMEMITPIIQQLKQHSVNSEEENQALNNILTLESERISSSFISEDKKKRYDDILNMLVDEFIEIYLKNKNLKNELQLQCKNFKVKG